MKKKKKKITILGSTGSIGTTTLKIVDNFKEHFNIIGLFVNKKTRLLKKQIIKYQHEEVCIYDEIKARKLQNEFPAIKVYSGGKGLIKLCRNKKVDLYVQALVGSIGIMPMVECIKNKKNIALANKETLVCAGQYIMNLARKNKVTIFPIDSEHSAILQCLGGHKSKDISKIILTGSGGPFLNYKGNFENITIKQALKHPNWKMGDKITIDSATLMNKGFEFIEAVHLFNVPVEKIKIVIHPQSIIHSMVEFNDGVVIAQMSVADMLYPIQFALFDTERVKNKFSRLDLNKLKELTFIKPDFKKFKCLDLAIKAAKKGGLFPAVLSQANDLVVEAFLKGKIKFSEIYLILSQVIRNFKKNKTVFNLKDIFNAMEWSKGYTESLLE